MEYTKTMMHEELLQRKSMLEPLLENPDTATKHIIQRLKTGTLTAKQAEELLVIVKDCSQFQPIHFTRLEIAILEKKESELLYDRTKTLAYLNTGCPVGNLSHLEERYQNILYGFENRKNALLRKLDALEQETEIIKPRKSFVRLLSKRGR